MNVTLLQNEEDGKRPQTQTVGSVHDVRASAPDEKVIATLLEVAENEEQRRRFFRKIWQMLLVLAIATMGINLLLFPVFKSHWQDMSGGLFYAFVTIINIIMPGGHYKPRRLQAAIAALLPFPGEPRLLLPLVDALHLPQTPEWKRQVYPALTEQLWNLTATDAHLSLDATRGAVLRGVLSQSYAIMPNIKRRVRNPGTFDDLTTDIAVAVMKTLAGMGDRKSISVLQKIIKAEAVTPNETVVRDAAREYLNALVQKIAENDVAQKQLQQRAIEPIRDPQKMVEEYVDTLAPETAKVALVEFLRTEPRGKLTCARSAVLLGVIACTLPYLGLQDILAFYFVVVIFILPSICALLVAANAKASTEARLIACELARRSENDTRLLPVLLDAVRYAKNTKQRDTFNKAFVRILPHLRPGDAARVPPAQRSYLRTWLKTSRFKKKSAKSASSNSQTLAVTALDALAVIGDTKALPDAEKIARRTRGGTYRETELHEAALHCVEALRARE